MCTKIVDQAFTDVSRRGTDVSPTHSDLPLRFNVAVRFVSLVFADSFCCSLIMFISQVNMKSTGCKLIRDRNTLWQIDRSHLVQLFK